ncbi:alpha/beta fold hydrolase [Actinokineospora sp.]|uniref:alpha/beta fold hydrolase n=1 Tax=Actinokineospora sp. TaxID=1872133 RepID=UPI003D6BF530
MNTTSTRFDVRSADGTTIAVWVEGEGPALVLVHGSIQDHTISAALVAELKPAITTYSMDRRGFGASGDGANYAIERDFENVAAVVDAVAAQTGATVAVWGHSYGANCAMGGAAMTDNADHLILYEPSLGLAYPPGWIDMVDRMLARGDDEGAIAVVLRDLLEFTDEQINIMRAGPEWAGRVRTAPTVVREARAEEGWVYRPHRFDGITAKTLMLSGSDSPLVVKAATDAALAAIPDARVHVLAGHAHIAHRTHPAMVGALVRDFIAS